LHGRGGEGRGGEGRGELWYTGTRPGLGFGPVDSSIGQSLHEALKCSSRAAQVYWGYKITFTGVRPKMAQPKDVPLVDRSKLVLDLESACFLVKAVTALQGRWEGPSIPFQDVAWPLLLLAVAPWHHFWHLGTWCGAALCSHSALLLSTLVMNPFYEQNQWLWLPNIVLRTHTHPPPPPFVPLLPVSVVVTGAPSRPARPSPRACALPSGPSTPW
jgi:hypothetical protein